jgi:hypothetical protein
MEFYKRKSVMEKLKGYCHISKDHSFMELTEWTNGEGWDICVSDEKYFSLTRGEAQLLSILTNIDQG